jgi:hypothetical protein
MNAVPQSSLQRTAQAMTTLICAHATGLYVRRSCVMISPYLEPVSDRSSSLTSLRPSIVVASTTSVFGRVDAAWKAVRTLRQTDLSSLVQQQGTTTCEKCCGAAKFIRLRAGTPGFCRVGTRPARHRRVRRIEAERKVLLGFRSAMGLIPLA